MRRILFGEYEAGMKFEEGATVTADGQGRYRIDLAKFPWSTTSSLRVMVLAARLQGRGPENRGRFGGGES